MGQRLGARLVDGLIVAVASYAISFIISLVGYGVVAASKPNNPAMFISVLGISWVILLIAVVLYEVLFIGLRGATPGKMAVGIKVVRSDTRQPIGVGSAFLRYLIPAAGSLLCFGGIVVYLSPFFDNTGWQQGWHDKAAHDIVVRTN